MPHFLCQLLAAAVLPGIYDLREVPEAPWMVAASDLSIAAAHFTIVLVFVLVILKRKDKSFHYSAVLFGLFMGFRGTTQLLAIWTIWHPAYQLGYGIKIGTTVLSVLTAIVLIRLLPVFHRLPSPAELEREIETRRRVEEEIHIKDERFRNFADNVQDYAIYLTDCQGTIETWNAGAERIKGYKAEEIIGKNFAEFYSAEDRERKLPEEAIRNAVTNGRHESEGWRVRKDGSRFWARVTLRPVHSATGELVGFSKVTRDLTESKAMEARYQTLLEAAPDALLIVNGEGRISYVNRRMEQLFGYTRNECMGKQVETLVPERYREAHAGHRGGFFTAPQLREMGSGRELFGLRRDGSEFPIEISLSPLEGPDGMSVTAAVRDITERKRATQLLAEKIVELRQSNEALEQFAHIASHDLQEPLRMVASYTQLLAKRYKGRLDADADEFIEFAVDGTRRMKALIEDLLLYSRTGRGSLQLREVSTDLCLQEALNNLFTTIEESGAEVTHGELPIVSTIESQLIQVFQNLLGNAIKYRGGRRPEIHVSATQVDKEWIFAVRDNGIGIEAKYFDRIFLIFQRLHASNEYAGTGIGLAICKRTLQQQGGRIWAESEVGRGSTFKFTIPVR